MMVSQAARFDYAGPHFVRMWSILASTVNSVKDILYNETGVGIGTVYRDFAGTIYDDYCLCQDITVTQKVPGRTGAYGLFEAMATFEYPRVRYDPPARTDSTWRWRMEKSLLSEPTDSTIEGYMIANSAQEPFEPGPTKYTIQRVLVGEKITTQFQSIEAAEQYLAPWEGKTNSGPFQGAATECLLSHAVQIEPAHGCGIAGSVPLRVTFKAEHRPSKTVQGYSGPVTRGGWVELYANIGGRLRISQPPYYKFVLDPETKLPIANMKLSGDGFSQLAASANPIIAVCVLYEAVDFNQMIAGVA